MKIWVVAICALAWAWCSAPAVGAEDDSGSYVHIATSYCFGRCPVFEVYIFSDNRIVFTGIKYVARRGVTTEIRPEGYFRSVLSELTQHGFWSLKNMYGAAPLYEDEDEYPHSISDCPTYGTDNPSIYITAQIGGVKKSIAYYYGCEGFDDEQTLKGLIDSLYEALDLDDWIKPHS